MMAGSNLNPLPVDEVGQGGVGHAPISLTTPGKRGRRRRGSAMTHLKYLRKRVGLTLEILSELTGISVSYLSRLESGSRRLNTDLIRRLSGAFGCDPAELLVDKIHEESAILPAEIRMRRGEMFGRSLEGSPITRSVEGARDLPVYALCAGASEGTVELKTEAAVEMRHRPAELAGKRDAFAARAGAYLHPHFTETTLIWFVPASPVSPEATVLLVLETGQVLLRKVWSVTPTSLHVCSLDPFEELKSGKTSAVCKAKNPSSHVTKDDGLIEIDRHVLRTAYRLVGTLDLSAL
ncbi:MAG: helix-turn-helix domain-containing protein [Holosporales bacterium]|nr:helix-turn-helix domain-containing protein [Holosporales bacterium]